MENEEFKKLFLTEAKEHLENLNNSLVILEKNSNDDETINKIFRSFHTLKGNSATMGYETFSKLAHKLEDLLDLIRNKKLSVDGNIIDILFKGCDRLEEGIAKIESNDKEPLNFQDVIDKVNSINPNLEKDIKKVDNITDKIEFSEKEKEEMKKFDQTKIKRIIIEFEDIYLKIGKALFLIKKIESDPSNKIIRMSPKKEELSEKLSTKLEIIMFAPDITNIEKEILAISKIKNHIICGLSESYTEHAKDAAKADIIKIHNEELKKVQEVRIDIKRLDNLMDMIGELLIYKMRLETINKTAKIKDLEEISNSISLLTESIQNEVIQERMIPVGSVFSRLPRIVRDLSKEEGKEIDLIIEGDDKKLDRTVVDKITDPLVHMIRNSIDHGIESPKERISAGKDVKGIIRLIATREKNNVIIEIEDDGAGIDAEKVKQVAIRKKSVPIEELNQMTEQQLQELVFHPGFSTNERITEISGRGVGMDIVMTNIREVGGNVYLDSKKGRGTKVRLELPLTVAIISVLVIRVENQRYAIPLSNIQEILNIKEAEIKTIQNKETYILRGEDIPLYKLKSYVGLISKKDDKNIVIIIESRKNKLGLIVDSIESQQQILIKNVDERIKKVKGIAGGTILGDGKACFILDIDSLIYQK